MIKENKTIAIGKDKDPYQVPLNLNRLSRYLKYIIPNSNRELKSLYEMFDLDSASRRKQRNAIDYKTDEKERRTLQNINKGLTMELFASGMINYFDHPVEVHANCHVRRLEIKGASDDKQYHAMPNNYAQGGVPDVEVEYENFKVILEVSAKSLPTYIHFKSQLSGALKHARSIRESGYDKPIYCLVIEDRTLKHTENKITLKEILETIKPSEQIYLSAISILEFAELGQKMMKQYKSEVAKIKSSDLLSVLQATVDQESPSQFDKQFLKRLEAVKPPLDSDWF